MAWRSESSVDSSNDVACWDEAASRLSTVSERVAMTCAAAGRGDLCREVKIVSKDVLVAVGGTEDVTEMGRWREKNAETAKSAADVSSYVQDTQSKRRRNLPAG